RTPLGRRIPYLAFGAIPFGIVYFLLWTPPFGGIEQVRLLFLYFVVFICLFDGLYTLTILNWASLYPEMYPSLEERAQVNAYRQSFGMLGLLLGVALPPLIYSTWGWKTMGAIFGAIITLALLIALWGSHERKEFSLDQPLSLGQALKATFKNRSFLIFVFANLLVQYTFTMILATVPFFAKYVLNADPVATTMILAAAFLTAIPALFVWRWLTLKFGAKVCFMLSMVSLALFLFPLLYLQTYATALLVSSMIGFGLAGFILVSDVIISDVIDEDEINTGTRREGMYFGINAFVTRFAIGLEALSLSSVFLYTGYNPYVFTQTKSFIFGLRMLIAGLPIIAMIFGFAIMFWYPLSGVKLKELKRRLVEVHLRKGVK
ncbi:MAG: MFS transporter, partial [Candidatus Margulisiibacteriota bacterium]